MRHADEVLRYWRAVELFEPTRLPYAQKNKPRKKEGEWVQDVVLEAGERHWPRLPWEPEHPLRRDRKPAGRYGAPVWRHIVYGGVFDLAELLEILTDRFGGAEEDHGARNPQESARFAFTLDEDGLLCEDTVVFSSAAWATGRALDPGPSDPRWLDGFEDAAETASQALTKLTGTEIPYFDPDEKQWRPLLGGILGKTAEAAVSAMLGGVLGMVAGAVAGAVVPGLVGSDRRPEPDGEEAAGKGVGRPVGLADIVAFHAHAVEAYGIPQPERVHLRIHSFLVHPRKDGAYPAAEPAFLNSFLIEDLDRVSGAARHGAALSAYLTEAESVPADRRTDVRASPDAVFDGLAPALFPLARWPAPTAHPLAASQQFAVNTAWAELGDAGLFSVNGPPGTGKTTMLRDLIAAILVARARRLAELGDPHKAFRERLSWTNRNDREARAWTLDPALTGFEIVVASSNNSAVENITTELPARNAIGEQWQDEAAYFSGVASALLDGAPAWGTLAAPLGRKENRRQFINRFWWGEDGMLAVLNDCRSGAPLLDGGLPVVTDWRDAVNAFKAALAEAERLRDERQAAYEALKRLKIRPDDGRRAAALFRSLEEARLQYDAAAGEVRYRTAVLDSAQRLLSEHQATRANRLGRLLFRRADRAWTTEEQRLLAAQAEASRLLHTAQVRRDHCVSEAARLEDAAHRAYRAHQDDARTRARAERVVAQARDAWPAHLPEGWEEWEHEKKEKSSPWSDEEWAAARTKVFLTALALHRAFIVNTSTRMYTNLSAFQEMMQHGPSGMPGEAVSAAWQTLFFAVPVISTTFASCGRLFSSSMGRESFGWLLIDEAGQATPQAAAGALWRARRAMVVGDPLQLEPVISLPLRIQDLLRGAFGAGPTWMPGRVSAQGLADRVNRFGTTVRRQEDGEHVPVWVGAPLLVHRRCEAPMFEVSNAIAYQGMMVSATPVVPFPSADRPYPGSSWVDVRSEEAQDKWVPEEGRALARILSRLHLDHGVPLDCIRVLSPFRDVVHGCRRTVRELGWPGTGALVIDTVHKMQGREADVVILVLGTHPDRSEKARRWAVADSPNLLNVAVSRARRRLFVIGDLSVWRHQGHCAVLARHLPHHSWRPSS